MIVFVAPFPALADEKDGFVQRVAWIDSLVSDQPRVYLDISLGRFWFARSHCFGNVTVLQLNAFLHFFVIASIVKRASIVYIHSVYNALRALSAYWVAKPITDLHGVVPEEMKYAGKPWRATLFGLVERVVLLRSPTVVHVTSAMRRHFQRKYGRHSPADHTIAILPKLTDVRGQLDNVLSFTRDPNAVIYAGGLQAWQNVPMMVDAAAAAAPQFRFIFLSGEATTLQRLANTAYVANFTCSAVDPHQMPDHYLTSTYGFVLRDPVLLNQVACPTKLVEYLHWGVIPIVLAPDIGDFVELGFAFVTLEAFRLGLVPDINEAARMRAINRQVVQSLRTSCEDELSTLRQVLCRV